jgi:hypothetical protein
MNAAALLSMILVAAALPAPKPAPSAAPTEKPLHEIGSVHATTPFCRKMIDTAVSSVDITLDNDVKIVNFENALRTLDFDSNLLVKHRSTDELRRRFVALRAAAAQGLKQMKAFREDAKAATDPEQRIALDKFADALAGALYRQQVIADRLGGYIAFLDSTPPVSDDDKAEMQLQHDIDASNIIWKSTNPFVTQPDVPEQLSHASKRAADEFETRAEPILKDEDDAANRIDPAFKRC